VEAHQHWNGGSEHHHGRMLANPFQTSQRRIVLFGERPEGRTRPRGLSACKGRSIGGKGGNKGKGMGAHTRSYWSGDRWPFFSAPEAEASRIENPQWKSSVGGDRRAARRSHAGFLGRRAGPGGDDVPRTGRLLGGAPSTANMTVGSKGWGEGVYR
jgi:hypothetical protein